jgi:hypothetical protein
MDGFNSQQGASDRDVEVDKWKVIAVEEDTVEAVADAYRIRTRQEAFSSTSPRWEDHNKVMCQVLTMVALSLVSCGDRQPAEAAAKTQHTQTAKKYLTAGMCVIPKNLTSRTATIKLRAGKGRWTTRRV